MKDVYISKGNGIVSTFASSIHSHSRHSSTGITLCKLRSMLTDFRPSSKVVLPEIYRHPNTSTPTMFLVALCSSRGTEMKMSRGAGEEDLRVPAGPELF